MSPHLLGFQKEKSVVLSRSKNKRNVVVVKIGVVGNTLKGKGIGGMVRPKRRYRTSGRDLSRKRCRKLREEKGKGSE